MSDNKQFGGLGGGFNMGRFNQLGATLRQSAQEISAKAAAQVNEINTKLVHQNDGISNAPSNTGDVDLISFATAPTVDGSSTTVTPSGGPTVTSAAAAAAPGAARTATAPDNKEMIEIMKKMKKKMELLATIKQQLSEKVEKIEKEKIQLRDFVVDEILNGGVSIQEGQDEVLQLQKAWRQFDEQNSMTLQSLQNEFKKLHAEQQQKSANGGDALASAWENEKQELINKHRQEINDLKETFSKQIEEANQKIAAATAASTNNDNVPLSPGSSDPHEEIQKIKEAAAAQLQAFKQKVATARNAELTKLKTEMKDQAKEMLDKKLADMKQQYETQMEELKKALVSAEQEKTTIIAAAEQEKATALAAVAADSSNKLAQQEQLQAAVKQQAQQHAVELESLRSSLEEAKMREIEKAVQDAEQRFTSQTEDKMRSSIEELTKKHTAEIEQLQKASAEKIAQTSNNATVQVQNISQKAQTKIVAIQNELEQAKQQHQAAIQSLQEEIETTRVASKQELEQNILKQQEANNASSNEMRSAMALKDTEIARLREELIAASSNSAAFTDREQQLQKQFLQEKEAMRIDFQQKYHAAIQKIQADANTLKDEAVKKVREESISKLEELKKQMEDHKRDQIEKLLAESEESKKNAILEAEQQAAMNVQTVQADMNRQLESLQQQLQDHVNAIQVKTNETKSLQAELDQMKSVLESVRTDGEQNSSQAMEEALDKQRVSYESRIQDDEKLYNEKLETLKQQVDELKNSKDQVLVESNTLQEEYKKSNEQIDLKKRELEQSVEALQNQLVQRDNDLVKQREELQNQIHVMTKEYESIQAQLSQKDEVINNSSEGVSQLNVALEALKRQLAETENQKSQELSAMQKAHELALTDITNRLQEKETELLQATTEANKQSNESYVTLQNQYQDLQSKYDNDVKKLRAEYDALAKTMQDEHEKSLADLRCTLQSDSSATTESLLAEARQKVIADKDAEIASLKVTYETKLQESAKKEAAVAQTFNKVKAAYAQKMQNLEKEMSEKITVLEKEKLDLKQALDVSVEISESVKQKFEKEIEDLNASVGKQTGDLVAEKDSVINGLNEKLQEADAATKKYEGIISNLETELKTIREEMDALKSSSGEELQSKLEEKLKSIGEDHSKAMQNAQAEHDEIMQLLRGENETLKARLEYADALELQKVELTNKLEAVMRKNEEDTAKMRETMANHVDKMTAQFKDKLENNRKSAEAEIAALQNLNREKEQKLVKLVDRLKQLTGTSKKLSDENELLKTKVEVETQNQNELRNQLESLKRQLEESNNNSSATASSLLQEQDRLQQEKNLLSNQIKNLQSSLQSKSNHIEELSGKLNALTNNLTVLTDERKEQDEKLERALKLEAKLKASESEATDLRDQINKLKLERQKNITLVERLQAEKETNERNHSQRTALVGMLETQLSQLNDKNAEINAKFEAALYDLSQKEELMQSNEERIRKLEAELEEAQSTARKSAESLAAAQKGAESKSTKMVESLQKQLQDTKQQMMRKSTAAQKLIQQREAECAELRATNRALQQEVDKGSYSDRRIFELAAIQSNRESLQISEIEARDSIIDRLKQALIDRDSDLANAEKHAREVESQIEELFRIRRREDVNIDYLKSIVVKYLALPPGSDERARLLPVLATLLQFDDNDYKIIEEGKNKVSWWGSSVIPTLINAPNTSVASARTGSAEVSVLRQQGSEDGKQTRTTSLQF